MPPRRQPPSEAEERLAKLAEELEAASRERDLASDGDVRGDAHHHPAEAATDAEARERDLAAQLRHRRREEQLSLARQAIAAGTYGICVDCGEPIPEGRLRAVPDAMRCVPCQSAASRRR